MNLFISNFVVHRITILIFHFTKIVLQFASQDYIYIYLFSRKQDYPFDRAEFSRKLSFFNFIRSPVASFLV